MCSLDFPYIGNMKNLILFICCTFVFFSPVELKSQSADTLEYKVVVRLKTSKNQIRAAEQTGRTELAKTIKLETWGANMEIVRAFRKYLGDRVFFIYSSEYKELKEGKTDSIFLSDSLELDPEIKPDLSNYYVAYWGNSPGTGMSVIMLLNQEFEETEIWVRTFGITPSNIKRIDPQVKKFCAKIQEHIPKYLEKKEKQKRKQQKKG